MKKVLWSILLSVFFIAFAGCASTEQPEPQEVEGTQATSGPQPTGTPAPTVAPTPTEVPPIELPANITFTQPNFIFQGDNPSTPIVTNQPSPAIENQYINPGALVFHEGQFHMFFNSFTAWPGIVEVGYMTSVDGYRWEMALDEPVFVTDQVPFGDGKADVSSVVVLSDGTWVLYFHTVGDGEIGYATASTPLGPWEVHPEPVLSPDPEGWDRINLGWPSVVRDGDEFRMYYGARTLDGFAIGLATSSDGFTWKKYDDPETAEEPFANSDPVLTGEQDWERRRVDRPRVVNTLDGWVMIYQGGPFVEERGLAISNDGMAWEKYNGNPIFNTEAFPLTAAKTWDTTLLYHEGAYYYVMELGTLSGTNLYLAKHEGSLRQ